MDFHYNFSNKLWRYKLDDYFYIKKKNILPRMSSFENPNGEQGKGGKEQDVFNGSFYKPG